MSVTGPFFLIIACSDGLHMRKLESDNTMCSFKIILTFRTLLAMQKDSLKGYKKENGQVGVGVGGFILTIGACAQVLENVCFSKYCEAHSFQHNVSACRKPPGLFQHLHRERLKTCRSAALQCPKGAIHTLKRSHSLHMDHQAQEGKNYT